MNLSLNDIPDEKLEAVLANLEAAKQQRQVENRLACYQPYQKQQAFHEAGATYRERLLMAGNQTGKTLAGGFE